MTGSFHAPTMAPQWAYHTEAIVCNEEAADAARQEREVCIGVALLRLPWRFNCSVNECIMHLASLLTMVALQCQLPNASACSWIVALHTAFCLGHIVFTCCGGLQRIIGYQQHALGLMHERQRRIDWQRASEEDRHRHAQLRRERVLRERLWAQPEACNAAPSGVVTGRMQSSNTGGTTLLITA